MPFESVFPVDLPILQHFQSSRFTYLVWNAGICLQFWINKVLPPFLISKFKRSVFLIAKVDAKFYKWLSFYVFSFLKWQSS